MSEIKVINNLDEWKAYVQWLDLANEFPYAPKNNPSIHEGKPDKYPCLVCTQLVSNISGTFDFIHTFAYREHVRVMFAKELVELSKLRAIVSISEE